jgi:glutathione S-transferase
MLRLFYSPGACSLVPHIALEEAGAEFEAVRVVLAQGEHHRPEFLAINPHARVPALKVGQSVITENLAINNFVADLFGKQGAVPRKDALLAAQCNQLLGWFASSVHIAFAQLWRAERFTSDPQAQEQVKVGGQQALDRYFTEIEALAGDSWLVGDQFTAADSYLLTFYRWGNRIGADMGQFPRWTAAVGRTLARPSVQKVLAREQLKSSEFQPPI